MNPTIKIDDKPTIPKNWLVVKKTKQFPKLRPEVKIINGKKWICFNQTDNKALAQYVVDIEKDNAFYKEEIKTTYFKLYNKELKEE